MELLVHTLMSNALAATCMAVIAVGLAWMCRRPALTHSLWLLVMLKLVTPPFISVSLPVASLIPPMESLPARSPIDHDTGLVTEREPLPQFDNHDRAWADIDERSSDSPTRVAENEPDFAQAAMPQLNAFARFWEGKASGEPEHHPARTEPRRPKITEDPFANLSIDKAPLHSELKSGWSWEPLVLMVILAGAVGWWALATARIIRFRRLLKDIRPASAEWQLQTDEMAEQIGLAWRPSLFLVPGRVPPMLWAIGGQPRLLVPSELWTRMAPDERMALLLHELAHLKRRDHWVRWLELVVGGLYWWYPVAWWARRALREAEEQCCDAWVVCAMPDRRRTYAGALLAAVEFVSGAPTAPAVASATSGSGHVSCLKRRLQMIVRAKTPKGLSWAGRFAVLAMAALALPLAPGWAQNKKSAPIESDGTTGAKQKATEDRVADELRKDPELVALSKNIDAAREQLASNHGATDKLIEGLQRQITKVEAEIDLKRSMLKKLHKNGTVALVKPEDKLRANKNEGHGVQPTFKTVSADHVQKLLAETDQTELELIDTMSMLDVKRDAYRPQAHRVEEEFKKDPEVLEFMRELEETREHLERLKRNLRQPHDAARLAAQNHFDKLQRKYDDLWTSKYPEILKRLSGDALEPGRSRLAIEMLEQKVETLKKKKSRLAERLGAIQTELKASNDDSFQAAFLSHQIQSLESWDEMLKKNLEQLKYEASQRRAADLSEQANSLQLAMLTVKYDSLRKAKHDQLLKERHESQRDRAETKGLPDRQTLALKQQFAIEQVAALRRDLRNIQSEKRKLEAQLKMQQKAESDGQTSDHTTKSRAFEQELALLNDHEKHLAEQINSFAKEGQFLTFNAPAPKEIQDGEKKGDKEDKLRDSAERIQEQLKDLVEKLGKELGPVAEEVRKSLEKAVGEIHKSLEKEGLTPEDLGKALEKSHDDLRKAFEGGGPVDKELREAIDKAGKDMQEAFDRARGDIQDQAETLRDRARDELRRGRDQAEALRDRARDELRRGRDEAERATRREGDEAQPDRDELESARREIRDLEQKLRSATRRLDELQRRESRRGPAGRRARSPEPEARPRDQATPRAEPKPAEPPRQPAVPATPSRPNRPNMRRPLPPNRPGPDDGRRAPQTENDTRLRELEEKMNRLLKELESLKGEKSSTEGKVPSPGSARPTKESSPVSS